MQTASTKEYSDPATLEALIARAKRFAEKATFTHTKELALQAIERHSKRLAEITSR